MAKKEDNIKNEKMEDEDLETIEAEVVEDDQLYIEEEDSQVDEYKESLQRLQAEFSNYKKRTKREKEETVKYASESLITKLLPVIDNMDRAFNNMEDLRKEELEDKEKIGAFFEGFNLIRNDFLKILKDQGLEEIKSDKEEFNPDYHHAVIMEESDEVESNHVIETFQKGYKLNDKVIRPAMVKVNK